jgi:hypothetical protein
MQRQNYCKSDDAESCDAVIKLVNADSVNEIREKADAADGEQSGEQF